ncbi:hypothetical protein NIES30_24035 [Phormidium tenue NIES-30]|uniref:RXYLT1 C-terminal domain-containing protein n=2 Tax=Phormidium tenue TaxID=126344 RepID=A0A1U7IYW5_9CYAN|nr:hypothetical protein NIES30_24035 [Phormidium tenue NIES-30]
MYIKSQLIPWDIYDPEPENCSFVAYFGKVLQTVDQALPNQGLTFYVTMVDIKELPSYGDNVFVLILGDEFYRIPEYINQVGGVFKCYGTHQIREQINLYRPLLRLSYFKFLVLGQSVKNMGYRLIKKIKHRLRKLRFLLIGKAHIAPIYDIPPGYFNSRNLPVKPIQNRTCDIFFDGSIVQHIYPVWSLRYWSKTPKAYSREQMVSSLKQFKANHPQFQVDLAVSVGYVGSNHAAHSTYSDDMMNAKICLAPRGTTLETYRLLEAMRYGCVTIVESLPDRWFYNGAPIIQIGSWQNLEPVLTRLLNDPELLQTLHQQTLDWWETKCSEKAVGRYITEQINALRLRV